MKVPRSTRLMVAFGSGEEEMWRTTLTTRLIQTEGLYNPYLLYNIWK